MKNQLPEWMTYPPVVLGFAAVCFAVPVLLGMSDRGAQFAGGLTSGLAAVIAVVVAGLISRENDRARDRRERHRDLSAVGTEISLNVGLALMAFRHMHPSLANYYRRANPLNPRQRNFDGSIPAPPEPVFISLLSPLVDTYTEKFPDRVVSKIGRFPRAIAELVTSYIAIVGYVREVVVKVSEGKSLGGIPSVYIGWEDCKLLSEHLESAVRVGDTLQSELQTFLNSLEVE